MGRNHGRRSGAGGGRCRVRICIRRRPERQQSVVAIYEDPEGSLWVGTAAGLDRFRDTKLTTLTVKEGLPANQTAMALETRDNRLFVMCPGGGLAIIRNGSVTALTQKDGLANLYDNGMYESRDGSLWMGNLGLTRYKDGKFTQYTAGDGGDVLDFSHKRRR